MRTSLLVRNQVLVQPVLTFVRVDCSELAAVLNHPLYANLRQPTTYAAG